MLTELSSLVGSIHDPLEEDHEDEVAKDEEEENYLREELQDDGVVLALADFVPDTQQDTEGHMNHSKDQKDLHLLPIQEGNAVGS